MESIIFPEPEIMKALAMAFVRVMFEHARFEREVRSLQSVARNQLEISPVLHPADSPHHREAGHRCSASSLPRGGKCASRHAGTRSWS
jgi:hypothetical protein